MFIIVAIKYTFNYDILGKRGSADSEVSSAFSPRSSLATTAEGSPPTAKAGTVVTSSRASKRR